MIIESYGEYWYRQRKRKDSGVTLLELLIVSVLLSMFMIFAIPMFLNTGIDCDAPDARLGYITRAKVTAIKGDIGQINLALQKYDLAHRGFPTDLSQLKNVNVVDPWGNPYQYLNFAGLSGNGEKRKDHNLSPVNQYFDLYSMGPNGVTQTPFTSTGGEDDIVMAADGHYIGVACFYKGAGK